MKVHLSRWVSLDVESNLVRCESEAHAAASGGADLVVFPESFLHGYTRAVSPERARALFGRISVRFPETSFLFGSFTEGRANRMTLWRGGAERARYDKVHLFAPNGERELWDPGDRYAAVRLPGFTLGLLNCNDLRFPEQARALRLRAGCDALAVVAWWPLRRESIWKTLLRARAIENNCWVMGCCVAASEVPEERFAGAGNWVFDPAGEPVPTEDDRTFDLDLAAPPAGAVDTRTDFVEVSRVEVSGDAR